MKSISINPQSREVLAVLSASYPHAAIALKFSTAWELLVATILSAQCTDVAVNKCTEKLFTKYTSLSMYSSVSQEEFEQDIRTIIFFRNKAKNIRAAAKKISDKYGGTVPNTMDELLTLPGVARKTANVILGAYFGNAEGIVVDTHVLRLSQRLRLVDTGAIGGGKKLYSFNIAGKDVLDFKKDADPVKIEKELMTLVPKSDWIKLSYMLIEHGRAVCKAVNPKCSNCALMQYCPSRRA